MEGEADAEIKGTPAMSVGLNTLPKESLASSNQTVESSGLLTTTLMRWIGSIPPIAQDEKKGRPFCSSYDIQQDEKAVLLPLRASQSEGS